ncbi:hypothetical protein KUTeg_022612 [Tegillarca granosa]|uniref:WD repeat-containing protein 41 n=1 Tax=Tegillarca granosa TaxID=220873 RepID=A0ABQ9E8M9_TEGGR|nr:hypothetical protein KUTeg_022612 [Tegillarca granosa]
MSMWQRLWKSGNNSSDANKSDEEKVDVDVLEDEQPYNPFTELLPLHIHTDIVRLLVLVDDRRCVSVGDDCLAVLWDIQLCCKLYVLSGHTRPITCVLLLDTKDNSNDWLLTGSSDKQIRVWDLDQGKCVQIIEEHNTSVRCLMSLQDHDIFISGGEGLHLWSGDGKLLSSYDRSSEEADISLMLFTKNERLVTASSKELRVYSVINETEKNETKEFQGKITLTKKLPPHREAIRELVMVSDIMFASGSLDGTIILWSTQSYLPTYTFNIMSEYKGKDQRYPYSIQHMICVEERYIMAAIGSGFALFDILTKRLICKKINAHYSKVLHLTFVCDGTFLATCSEDGSIRLWGHVPTGNLTLGERADMAHSIIERFMGVSTEEKMMYPGYSYVFEPNLLGECLAHSGAVENIIECGGDTMLSCGVDGLVIAWKIFMTLHALGHFTGRV